MNPVQIKNPRKKKSVVDRQRMEAMDWFMFALLLLMSIVTLLPFYQVVLLSFADRLSYAKHPLYLWPYTIDFAAYKVLFEDARFLNALMITVGVTVLGVTLNMLLSVSGAYVLSKKDLPGRRFFLNMVLFTMLFGGGMIPSYLVNKSLGLVNHFLVLILPTAISSYYMIIMKNYFMSLPAGLLEAAYLDGASELTILRRIVVPISKPFMATFFLFYGVARWNEWYMCQLYINKSKLYTLQIYLRNVVISMDQTLNDAAKAQLEAGGLVNTVAVQMATIVVTTLPILCLYPFLQKHFVRGIMVGGMKE